jgi:hypothetical protein
VVSKCVLKSLLLVALLLPAALLVIVGLSRLLFVLGDAPVGLFFERLAIGGGLIWVLDLLGLLLAVAAKQACERDDG